MNSVFINAKTQSIEPIETHGLADLQAAVGGRIETACFMDTGDIVYCNEDGLMNPDNDVFVAFIDGSASRPLAGSCIVVGPVDKNGNTTDCLYSPEDIDSRVMFMTRKQVLEWLNANTLHERTMGLRHYN